MTVKVIILNGPPRSGKDTFIKLLQLRAPTQVVHMKFSYVLKKAVHTALGIGVHHFADTERYDAVKDEPQEDFFNNIPREIYIRFSEEFMKPIFGDDIFGRVFMRLYYERIKMVADKTVVITDCGFREELDPLLEYFKPGELLLVKLLRDGYDFKGDSRGYIDINNTPHFRYQCSITNPEDKPESMINELKNYGKTMAPLIIMDKDKVAFGSL